MTTATITPPIPYALCLDLLTTAVEGGSDYWLACNRVERDSDLNVTKIVGCCDTDDTDTEWPDADIETIRLGIKRLVEGTVKVRADIRTTLIAALQDADNTDWDAEVADVALQAGLLGEITYG